MVHPIAATWELISWYGRGAPSSSCGAFKDIKPYARAQLRYFVSRLPIGGPPYALAIGLGGVRHTQLRRARTWDCYFDSVAGCGANKTTSGGWPLLSAIRRCFTSSGGREGRACFVWRCMWPKTPHNTSRTCSRTGGRMEMLVWGEMGYYFS